MARHSKIKRWFGRLKGSDFIYSESGSVDVFVHYSPDHKRNGYRGLHEEPYEKPTRRKRKR